MPASPHPAAADDEALDVHSHLQALLHDTPSLGREVVRLAAAGGTAELPTLVASVHRVVAAHEQLELLALALLAPDEYDNASDDTQLRLSLVDELLRDAPPLTRLRVATQQLRLNTVAEAVRALLLRLGERAMEQLLANANASDAAHAVQLLLALHDASGSADFKVATLVWKYLTKLATAFGAALVDSNDAFQGDDVLASAIAALEQCALELYDRGPSTPEAALVTTLRFLRLYWRAFQGQLVCFLPALTSEVEASVLALVNVAASLVDVALGRPTHVVFRRVQAEASRLLLLVIAVAEKLGAAADASASTRELVRVLLWHPHDDMVRAIEQRRDERRRDSGSRHGADERATDEPTSVQVGHLLVVAAFSATDDNVLPAKDPSEERGGAKILAAAAMLLERYETCAGPEPVRALSDARSLFVDAFLALLLKVDDVAELQLFLIQQLVHPSGARHEVVSEVWKELLCFGWDDHRAAAVLVTLLSLAQVNDADATADTTRLAPGVQQTLFELIAYVFPALPAALQRLCVAEATRVVDTLFSDGPSHAFTRQVASQGALLEHLTAASFLTTYSDELEKEAWVAKYLPLSFECCGTILDLLNAPATASSSLPPAERAGMMRILDVCLLVAKAVLDDSDARGVDVAELAGMLVPMSSEILTQLSVADADAMVRSTGATLAREASRSLTRTLETCTYVLGSLGHVLKRNASNQFVLALRDLALVVERAPVTEASGVAVYVAWFARRTLFDVHVAESDLAVVWQLFTRLFQRLSILTGSGLHVPVVLDAFYRFVAHSNVPTYASDTTPVRGMLAESAQPRFREFLALKRLSPADADQALRAELRTRHRTHPLGRLGRFPSDRRSVEPPVDTGVAPSASKRTRHSADGDVDADSKRRKLEALVTMCRRTHEMFSGASSNTALLRAVGEQEMVAATQLLEQLLASGALA